MCNSASNGEMKTVVSQEVTPRGLEINHEFNSAHPTTMATFWTMKQDERERGTSYKRNEDNKKTNRSRVVIVKG